MRLIAAVDQNWGIGFQNELLFRVRSDLRRFRAETIDGIIICGRKTLLSFPDGKPLDRRLHIVLSRNPDFKMDDAIICHDLPSVFTRLRELTSTQYTENQIQVVGGAEIYQQLLPYCREALITYIHATKEADRFLPRIDRLGNWQLTGQSEIFSEGDILYEYRTYQHTQPQLWL